MGKRKSRMGAISIKELGLNIPITPKTALAGYAAYKWVGPKVSKLVTDGKIPLIKPTMVNGAAIAKVGIGLGVIMLLPKKYKGGFANEINAAALGLAFNGAEEYAKAKGFISGNGMRVVHRGVGGSPQNQTTAVSGSPQNRSISVNGRV